MTLKKNLCKIHFNSLKQLIDLPDVFLPQFDGVRFGQLLAGVLHFTGRLKSLKINFESVGIAPAEITNTSADPTRRNNVKMTTNLDGMTNESQAKPRAQRARRGLSK